MNIVLVTSVSVRMSILCVLNVNRYCTHYFISVIYLLGTKTLYSYVGNHKQLTYSW